MKLNKIIIPMTASAILLGACGNSDYHKEDELSHSKAGEVTVQDVMKDLGNDQVSTATFRLTMNKILEDKYGDKEISKKVDEEIDNQAKQFGGEDMMKNALKQQGSSLDEFKANLKSQKLNELLIEKKIKISDKELKDQSAKASHILIETSDTTDKDKAKKKAEDLKKQLDEGASFKELAVKNSDDPETKEQAGSLGYVLKKDMVKNFDKELFNLKPGEISDPVKTEYGYHIIYREKPTDFDKHKDKLKKRMIESKIAKDPDLLVNAYKDLIKEYDVDFKNKDVDKYIKENFLDASNLKEQAEQQMQH